MSEQPESRVIYWKRQQDTEWAAMAGVVPMSFTEPTLILWKQVNGDIVWDIFCPAGKYLFHADGRSLFAYEVAAIVHDIPSGQHTLWYKLTTEKDEHE